MKIKSIATKPINKTVHPSFLFDVTIEYARGTEVPMAVNGMVYSTNRSFLGCVSGYAPGRFSKELSTSNVSPQQEEILLSLPMSLSRQQLNHIEDLRASDDKGNVYLHCDLKVEYVSYFRDVQDKFFIQLAFENAVGGSMHEIKIPGSDWLHDYLGPWQSAKYVIFELAQPEMVTTSANSIQGKIERAIKYAEEATESRRVGDWNRVIETLRKVWESLRGVVEIKDILIKDGYPEAAADELDKSIKAQFNFASKFMHSKDRSSDEFIPAIKASKEDAELVYTFAMAYLNMVAQKTQRLSDGAR